MKEELVLWVNRAVLGYFALILVAYTAVTFLSWIQVRRYYRRRVHARLQRSVRSRLTPPISICTRRLQRGRGDRRRDPVAARLRYPELEVVVVNDGSTDGTLGRAQGGVRVLVEVQRVHAGETCRRRRCGRLRAARSTTCW